MAKFELVSPFPPTGDQPQAIAALVHNLEKGAKDQVLLGVTGSGKTFTMANVIARVQRPTLVISHNKTLAAQLYQEFREFFPLNAVSYFVSYYDFYQPEAYIPQTDTYIEKETQINEEIDKLRLAATNNLLTRPDNIIVASVSCIYNIGSPKEYGHFVLELRPGMKVSRESILKRLVELMYQRSDYGFHRGKFRVRGEVIDLFPAYQDETIRLVVENDHLTSLALLNPITGRKIKLLSGTVIYPAKHYMTDPRMYEDVLPQIRNDLAERVDYFKSQGKLLEAQRLEQRVNYDLEMIETVGYVNGVENYSRYFDGRKPGEPPYTLIDYFEEAAGHGWLLFIDESHLTAPQLRGMYHGDRSRKQTLIDFGFRLPAALDNRPLRFEEFLRRTPQTIYVSATPDEWEINRAHQGVLNIKHPTRRPDGQVLKISAGGVVEQLIRPTGLVDPEVIVRPAQGQIDDLRKEIQMRVKRQERVLVTTLTKRMAEDLAAFLEERGVKVHYLHSDIETLERSDILADLRGGKYEVVVGINLLREGLDLPEVSLVAVLDADKEGFLRSRVSLIQTMGRAARHVRGQVILYADTVTGSMRYAITEVERRRKLQRAYNKKHGITPRSVEKPIRDRLVQEREEAKTKRNLLSLTDAQLEAMTPLDKREFMGKLRTAMRAASRDLNFEQAAQYRDLLSAIEATLL